VPASHEKLALDGFPLKSGINSPNGSNRKDFLTPSSLVFRLTGQGLSFLTSATSSFSEEKGYSYYLIFDNTSENSDSR
jgi:hypothetical protein